MYIEHCSVDLKKRYEKYLEDKKADSICIVKYNGNNDHEPAEVPPVDNGQRNVTKMQEEIGSDNVIQYISCVLKNKRGNKLDKTEGKNYCIFIRKKNKKDGWTLLQKVKVWLSAHRAYANAHFFLNTSSFKNTEKGRDAVGVHRYELALYNVEKPKFRASKNYRNASS